LVGTAGCQGGILPGRAREEEKMNFEELKTYLEQARYEEEQDRAWAEILRNRKCMPYCLNGNYR